MVRRERFGCGCGFHGVRTKGRHAVCRSVPTRCVEGLVLRGMRVCVAHFGRRDLETSEEVLGAKHPETLISVGDVGGLLKAKGDYDGAEPLMRCKV